MELAVRVIDTEQGFFALEAEWNELQERSSNATIFSTFEWAHGCWTYRDFRAGAQPFIITLYDGPTLVGLAPFCLRSAGAPWALQGGVLQHIGMGYRWLADYLDVISASGYEEAVMRRMLTFLKEQNGRWDTLDWHELSDTSPSYRAVARAAKAAGLRFVATPENICHTIALPPTWEEFLATLSWNTRRKVNRKTRKIIKECDARFEQVCDEAEVDRVLQALHAFQDERWSPQEKVDREVYMGFIRKLAPAMLRRGWLDLRVVRAGDTTIASTIHFRFNGTVYAFLTGFDPDEKWNTYSIGSLLLADSIKHAIEDGYRSYDQGRGNEEYKTHFATVVHHNYRFRIVHSPLLHRGYQAANTLRDLRNVTHRQVERARESLRQRGTRKPIEAPGSLRAEELDFEAST
jgi:CelD/BcsL family acetyltransferase involved in cellulose biosynthesis